MRTGRTGARVAIASALALAAAACSGGEEPVAIPTPSPTETVVVAPPEPEPLAMTHRVEALQVNGNDILSKDRGVTASRRAMDNASVAAVSNSLIDLLRGHLDDLNVGGPGMLADIGEQIFGVDPAMTSLATTSLASPANPATAADLVLRIGVDGAPRWAQADLAVSRQDGSPIILDLVFATDGDLTLVLLGGEEVPA